MQPFGFFEYAKIGVPLLLAALAYMMWVGQRLLPTRQATNPPTDVDEWVGERSRRPMGLIRASSVCVSARLRVWLGKH